MTASSRLLENLINYTPLLEQKLDTFKMRCLRQILRIRWSDTISNEELYTVELKQRNQMKSLYKTVRDK